MDTSFINNKATSFLGRGGGICIIDRNKYCKVDSCLIFWNGHTTINFINNSAYEGPMIYGGMMDRCSKIRNNSPISLLTEVLYSNNRRYNFKAHGIYSDSVKFCFCDTFKPDCNTRMKDRKLFPGQTLFLYVACVDQMEQPMPCEVRSEYSLFYHLGLGQNLRYIRDCEKLSFNAHTNYQGTFSLSIMGKLFCNQSMWNTLRVRIVIEECPRGFQRINGSCQCDTRLQKTFNMIECDIDNNLVHIKKPGWFSYNGDCLRVHDKCPLNYCNLNESGSLLSNPDSLCANNHGGILCGGCVANYSVGLGSWKCMKCSNLSSYNFIWLTVVIALAGVVLVVFLLLVKMTVSSGTINGLIFYANILSFSGLLDYTCSIHPLLQGIPIMDKLGLWY